jgi:parvulin-like peptidyl-prolyl isomerase
LKNTIGRLWIGMAVIAGLTGCASRNDLPDPGSSPVAPPAGPVAAPSPSDPAGTGADHNVRVASSAQGSPNESITAVKPAPWQEAPIATVNKRSPIAISMGELVQPLIEAHGLDLLLNIVQRDLAKQGADEAHIAVTSDDFKAERERTLGLLFKKLDDEMQDKIDQAEKAKKPDEVKRLQDEKALERQQLLKQIYEQRHLTATDFDILIQTNTYLRKIAEPTLKGQITDEILRAEFAARFGEKVRVRHIELKRPQDQIEVRRRLAAGEKFEDVARELSTNPETRALGGELLPFTREASYPKVFKEVAFALKVGEVSDLVNVGDTWQIIKLEERMMPKAVVFEQQRDILFNDVHEHMIEGVIVRMRTQIGEAIKNSLKISDPVMEKQFQERVDELNATIKGKEAAEQEMDKDRDRLRVEEEIRARQQAATQPSTTRPAAPAATQPVTAPAAAPAPRPVAPAPVVPAPAPVAPPPVAPPPATAPLVPTAPLTRPATAPAAPRAALHAAPPATKPG